MKYFPCTVDTDLLLGDLDRVTVTSVKDGSGHPGPGHLGSWIHGLANTRLYGTGYPDRLAETPHIHAAILQIPVNVPVGALRQVMVNVLKSGGQLSKHRDKPPDHARFHLPVVTAPEVTWWDEINGPVTMLPGSWYGPVPYCEILHSVVNKSETARIHVIADFEKASNT